MLYLSQGAYILQGAIIIQVQALHFFRCVDALQGVHTALNHPQCVQFPAAKQIREVSVPPLEPAHIQGFEGLDFVVAQCPFVYPNP